MTETVTTLFLARHGQTQWNLEQRLQGRMNSPLTQLGIEQAFAAQQKLINHDIHIAYCSPLQRAVETGALIVADWPIKLVQRDKLSEISLGPWEGKTYSEIKQSDPTQFDNFWNRPHQYQLAGAETYQQLQTRVLEEINQIIRENIGKNILVVSHGIAIKVILAHVLKKCLSELGRLAVMENGDVLRIQHANQQLSLFSDCPFAEELAWK